MKKPVICLSYDGGGAPAKLRDFVGSNQVQVLNVAGPRESEEPGVGRFVATILSEALVRESSQVELR